MVSVDVDMSLPLDAEGRPASARRLCVRVVEDEPLTDQARVVVARRAVEKPEAARVDVDARAFGAVEHVVAVARRGLPRERVAEAGTAPGLDPDAQAAIGNPVFRCHFPDEFSGVLADVQHTAWGPNPDQKS